MTRMDGWMNGRGTRIGSVSFARWFHLYVLLRVSNEDIRGYKLVWIFQRFFSSDARSLVAFFLLILSPSPLCERDFSTRLSTFEVEKLERALIIRIIRHLTRRESNNSSHKPKRAKFVRFFKLFRRSYSFWNERKKRGGIIIIIIIKNYEVARWRWIDKFAGKKVGEGNLVVNGTRLAAVRPPTNGRARQ